MYDWGQFHLKKALATIPFQFIAKPKQYTKNQTFALEKNIIWISAWLVAVTYP
jgi:hypothetical protein